MQESKMMLMLCCFLFGVSRNNDVGLLVVAELCDWLLNYLQFIEEFLQFTISAACKAIYVYIFRFDQSVTFTNTNEYCFVGKQKGQSILFTLM